MRSDVTDDFADDLKHVSLKNRIHHHHSHLKKYIGFFLCSNIPELPSNNLQREDCEEFKCEVVSLGRKAYELVSKGFPPSTK